MNPFDTLEEYRRALYSARGEIRRLRARMVAAEQVAALTEDHMKNCSDSDLADAVTEWQYSTGMAPATVDEASEASWEMRAGK